MKKIFFIGIVLLGIFGSFNKSNAQGFFDEQPNDNNPFHLVNKLHDQNYSYLEATDYIGKGTANNH